MSTPRRPSTPGRRSSDVPDDWSRESATDSSYEQKSSSASWSTTASEQEEPAEADSPVQRQSSPPRRRPTQRPRSRSVASATSPRVRAAPPSPTVPLLPQSTPTSSATSPAILRTVSPQLLHREVTPPSSKEGGPPEDRHATPERRLPLYVQYKKLEADAKREAHEGGTGDRPWKLRTRVSNAPHLSHMFSSDYESKPNKRKRTVSEGKTPLIGKPYPKGWFNALATPVVVKAAAVAARAAVVARAVTAASKSSGSTSKTARSPSAGTEEPAAGASQWQQLYKAAPARPYAAHSKDRKAEPSRRKAASKQPEKASLLSPCKVMLTPLPGVEVEPKGSFWRSPGSEGTTTETSPRSMMTGPSTEVQHVIPLPGGLEKVQRNRPLVTSTTGWQVKKRRGRPPLKAAIVGTSSTGAVGKKHKGQAAVKAAVLSRTSADKQMLSAQRSVKCPVQKKVRNSRTPQKNMVLPVPPNTPVTSERAVFPQIAPNTVSPILVREPKRKSDSKGEVPSLHKKSASKGQVPTPYKKSASKGEVPSSYKKSASKGEVPSPYKKSASKGKVPSQYKKSASKGEIPPPHKKSASKGEVPPPNKKSAIKGEIPPPHKKSARKGEVHSLHTKSASKSKVPPLHKKSIGKGEVPPLHEKSVGKGEVSPMYKKSSGNGEVPSLHKKAPNSGEASKKRRHDSENQRKAKKSQTPKVNVKPTNQNKISVTTTPPKTVLALETTSHDRRRSLSVLSQGSLESSPENILWTSADAVLEVGEGSAERCRRSAALQARHAIIRATALEQEEAAGIQRTEDRESTSPPWKLHGGSRHPICWPPTSSRPRRSSSKVRRKKKIPLQLEDGGQSGSLASPPVTDDDTATMVSDEEVKSVVSIESVHQAINQDSKEKVIDLPDHLGVTPSLQELSSPVQVPQTSDADGSITTSTSQLKMENMTMIQTASATVAEPKTCQSSQSERDSDSDAGTAESPETVFDVGSVSDEESEAEWLQQGRCVSMECVYRSPGSHPKLQGRSRSCPPVKSASPTKSEKVVPQYLVRHWKKYQQQRHEEEEYNHHHHQEQQQPDLDDDDDDEQRQPYHEEDQQRLQQEISVEEDRQTEHLNTSPSQVENFNTPCAGGTTEASDDIYMPLDLSMKPLPSWSLKFDATWPKCETTSQENRGGLTAPKQSMVTNRSESSTPEILGRQHEHSAAGNSYPLSSKFFTEWRASTSTELGLQYGSRNSESSSSASSS